MKTDDHQLSTLYLAARSAAGPLRSWVLKAYMLPENQLDASMTTSLAQMDQVARFGTYFGYDVSRAPAALIEPLRTYTMTLRQGSKARSGEEIPRHLFTVHRRIEALVTGPARPPEPGDVEPADE